MRKNNLYKVYKEHLKIRKKHGLWIDYTRGMDTLKDKEKEKEKDKDKVIENPGPGPGRSQGVDWFT